MCGARPLHNKFEVTPNYPTGVRKIKLAQGRSFLIHEFLGTLILAGTLILYPVLKKFAQMLRLIWSQRRGVAKEWSVCFANGLGVNKQANDAKRTFFETVRGVRLKKRFCKGLFVVFGEEWGERKNKVRMIWRCS